MHAPHEAIRDRYDLLERLGMGGMATVWRASDRLLGRVVAVKILNGETASDPIFVERFRREAQAVAQLNHPNIVSVYDWGQTEDSYFMVMEFVDGENLKQKLREGPLDEAEALDIAAQVAAALEAAHEQGVIHRDIKPQNILLTPSGQVKVVDFGIAFTPGRTQLTRAHAVAGTAHYLSPEQAQTKPADARSDLYSLGVVLYEMLIGREPFEGGTLIEIAMKQINEAPLPPRQLRPSLSVLTNAIVLRAMAKNPAHRYQSAREMRIALIEARDLVRAPAAVQPDRTVSAPLDPYRAAPSKPVASRRRPLLFGIPALLALVAIVPTVALHEARQPPSAGASQTPTGQTPRHVAAAQHKRHHASRPRPSATALPAGVRAAPTRQPQALATPATTQAPSVAELNPTPVATLTSTSLSPVTMASAGDSSPDQTVADFYSSVAAGHYSHAASLWTAAMQSRCDPTACIDNNFSQMQSVGATYLRVLSNTGKNAQVQVTVQETYPGGSGNRTLTGTWFLTRGPSGWLMDAESFQ